MAIYIYKNNQQIGPFEEGTVLSQLRDGTLQPDVMAIRTGETQWTTLGAIFPHTVAEQKTVAMAEPSQSPSIKETMPEYRSTIWLKVFFGLCLLGILIVFLSASYYAYRLPTDDRAVADYASLINTHLIVRNIRIGAFLCGFFVFLAILLSFKNTLLESNQLRVGIRAIFLLVVLTGFVTILFGIGSYFTYVGATPSSIGSIRSMQEADNKIGPYRRLVVLGPLGVGVVLFGISGFFMTKRRSQP